MWYKVSIWIWKWRHYGNIWKILLYEHWWIYWFLHDSEGLLNVVFIRPFLRTNNLWKSRYIVKLSNSPYYKKENVAQNPDKPNFVQHFSVKSVCIPRTRIYPNHKSKFWKAALSAASVLSMPLALKYVVKTR